MAKIRHDDNVIVISGKDKGKTGKVIRVEPAKSRVYVEGLNMVKRHQRPVPGRPNLQVGVIEKEGPIHVSNVAIVDPKDHKPTRVGSHDQRAGQARPRHPPLRSGARLMARLKDRYNDEIRDALVAKFGYSTPMQAPAPGQGHAQHGRRRGQAGLEDARGGARQQLADIAGQKPNIRRARKSVAAFKLREGMPVGLTVTLRDVRAYEFIDRLTSVAIPRLRDFRGLNPKSFDGRGNYNMGIKEQVIFPEIDYDTVDQVRGLDVAITTTAQTDTEAFTLLDALGMPFARDGRPKQYESLRAGEPVAA